MVPPICLIAPLALKVVDSAQRARFKHVRSLADARAQASLGGVHGQLGCRTRPVMVLWFCTRAVRVPVTPLT